MKMKSLDSNLLAKFSILVLGMIIQIWLTDLPLLWLDPIKYIYTSQSIFTNLNDPDSSEFKNSIRSKKIGFQFFKVRITDEIKVIPGKKIRNRIILTPDYKDSRFFWVSQIDEAFDHDWSLKLVKLTCRLLKWIKKFFYPHGFFLPTHQITRFK